MQGFTVKSIRALRTMGNDYYVARFFIQLFCCGFNFCRTVCAVRTGASGKAAYLVFVKMYDRLQRKNSVNKSSVYEINSRSGRKADLNFRMSLQKVDYNGAGLVLNLQTADVRVAVLFRKSVKPLLFKQIFRTVMADEGSLSVMFNKTVAASVVTNAAID